MLSADVRIQKLTVSSVAGKFAKLGTLTNAADSVIGAARGPRYRDVLGGPADAIRTAPVAPSMYATIQ